MIAVLLIDGHDRILVDLIGAELGVSGDNKVTAVVDESATPDKMVQNLVQKKWSNKWSKKIVKWSKGPMVQSIFYPLPFRDITG